MVSGVVVFVKVVSNVMVFAKVMSERMVFVKVVFNGGMVFVKVSLMEE